MNDDVQKKTPFDYVNSIFLKRREQDDDLRGYNTFIVNRALSYYRDCVFYTNEMNFYYNVLQPDQQYEFLYATIRKGKRPFVKWVRIEKDEDIELIQEYYKCNRQRAKEILSIINNDTLNVIREKMFKGGKSKN